MVELVERAEMAIDEVIDVMGRATIEAVLDMSAEALAGPKQACKARTGGEAAWYGRQGGQVVPRGAEGARGAAAAADERPGRGRRARGAGLPGDATAGAIGGPDAGDPAGGVSTRRYGDVIPEMADTVGVSKSAVSWDAIQASERVLAELMERRLEEVPERRTSSTAPTRASGRRRVG